MNLYLNLHFNECQHFWHHMMGEFLPIIAVILKNKANNIFLYNSQRTWNNLLDNFYRDIESENLKIILQNKKTDDMEYINIDRWDYNWNESQESECLFAIDWLKKETLKFKNNKEYKSDEYIIIQLRKNLKELTNYYQENYIDTKKYGKELRSVGNLDKLKYVFYNMKFRCDNIWGDGNHLYDQIYPYINKNKLILGHGAGMVFSLFLNDDAKILEIITPDKFTNNSGDVQGLIRFSKIKNFKLNRIILENHKDIFSINIKEYLINNFI